MSHTIGDWYDNTMATGFFFFFGKKKLTYFYTTIINWLITISTDPKSLMVFAVIITSALINFATAKKASLNSRIIFSDEIKI